MGFLSTGMVVLFVFLTGDDGGLDCFLDPDELTTVVGGAAAITSFGTYLIGVFITTNEAAAAIEAASVVASTISC